MLVSGAPHGPGIWGGWSSSQGPCVLYTVHLLVSVHFASVCLLELVLSKLRNKWFSGAGGPSQVTESITYKGLFPIVVASCVWGQQWFRQHVLFRSDKEAVVFILTLRTSKFPSLIQLLSKLLFSAAQFNFMFTAQQSCPGRS